MQECSVLFPQSAVWKVLGYGNPRSFRQLISDLTRRGFLKEGEHFVREVVETEGGEQRALCLTYEGLQRVIMSCSAPKSELFKKAMIRGDFKRTLRVEGLM